MALRELRDLEAKLDACSAICRVSRSEKTRSIALSKADKLIKPYLEARMRVSLFDAALK